MKPDSGRTFAQRLLAMSRRVEGALKLSSAMPAGITGWNPVSGFPIEIAGEIIGYFRTREVERTRRTLLSAMADIEIERIESDGRAFDELVSGAFDKRSKAAEAFRKLLTITLENDDAEQTSLLLRAITALLVSSPLDRSSIGLLTRSSSSRRRGPSNEGQG
jgi:hypothetical protein